MNVTNKKCPGDLNYVEACFVLPTRTGHLQTVEIHRKVNKAVASGEVAPFPVYTNQLKTLPVSYL